MPWVMLCESCGFIRFFDEDTAIEAIKDEAVRHLMKHGIHYYRPTPRFVIIHAVYMEPEKYWLYKGAFYSRSADGRFRRGFVIRHVRNAIRLTREEDKKSPRLIEFTGYFDYLKGRGIVEMCWGGERSIIAEI